MSAALHLTITTPAVILVDSDDVASVRAEDASGSFGILPSHADLLTMLTPSVVRWRTVAGRTGFCAVKGGVLTVAQGRRVEIACREGIVDASLQTLEDKVRTVRAAQLEADRRAKEGDPKKLRPRDKIRIRLRCKLCGRPRAVYRKFGICRICFRNLASDGLVPGVKKASW